MLSGMGILHVIDIIVGYLRENGNNLAILELTEYDLFFHAASKFKVS